MFHACRSGQTTIEKGSDGLAHLAGAVPDPVIDKN